MTEFNFEGWLQENKIEEAKDVLIKHNMATLQDLSMHNPNLSLLITDPKLGTTRSLVAALFTAIQELDKLKQLTEEKDDDPEEKKFDTAEQTDSDIIILRPKEYEVKQQIEKYIDYFQDLQNELVEAQNKFNHAKISFKTSIEKTYKTCCDDLKNEQNKVSKKMKKVKDKLNGKETTLKRDIQQYQKEVNTITIPTDSIDDILQKYSITINNTIKHYKNTIIQCKQIIKHHSLNNNNRYDEYIGFPPNAQREKQITEIKLKEKIQYMDIMNEVEKYNNQIEEFLNQDVKLWLYKTESNIDSDAPIYWLNVNQTMYEDIINNIDSFVNFKLCEHRQAEIQTFRNQIKATLKKTCVLQAQFNVLQSRIGNQEKQKECIWKEIYQYVETEQDITEHENARPFQFYDTKLWNTSHHETVIWSKHAAQYSSNKGAVIVAYCDSMNGYINGIHKWSVKQINAGYGVRSIGVISSESGLDSLSFVVGGKIANGFYFVKFEHPKWVSNETITVVLNCNCWKVFYYKTVDNKTKQIKQESIVKNRNYYFALVVDASGTNNKRMVIYQSVTTPSIH